LTLASPYFRDLEAYKRRVQGLISSNIGGAPDLQQDGEASSEGSDPLELGLAPRLKKGEVYNPETGMPMMTPRRPRGGDQGSGRERGAEGKGYAGPSAPTRLGLLMRNDEMG
jgi:hypothetical protein